MKYFFMLWAVLSLVGAATAQAQPSPLTVPGMPSLTAKPAPAAPAPAVTPAQAQARAALDILKDDAQRARLIGVLETMAKAQAQVPAAAAPAAAPAATPADPAAPAAPATAATPDDAAVKTVLPLPLDPDSVGAQVLLGVSERLTALADDVVRMTRAVTDFPLLWNWLTRLATDSFMQMAILDAVWRLAVVLGLGLAAEWLAARALRRPMRALAQRAPLGPGHLDEEVAGIADAEAGQTEWLRRRASAVVLARRLPYVAGSLALDLLPVLAVIAIGYALLAAGVAGRITARLVILAVLDAYVVWRLVVAVARAVTAPGAPRLRMVPIGEDAAATIVYDVGRLAAVAIAGYVIAEVALLFGLYRAAHDALLKLDALVVYAMIVVVVLRNRREIRDVLRARPGRKGFVAVLRNWAAGAWERIIIFYLLALWLVWALEVPDGFARLLRLVVVAVVVISVARIIALAIHGGLDRALRASTGLAERYPGLDMRVAGYHPVARVASNLAIGAIAVVAMFQAWGLDAFAWFIGGALGARILAALGTIALTLVAALAVWELVNAGIQRHLARLAREAQLARSARLRTLLPMFRTTLLASVCIVAGLMVLSEVGVNIAPLLAGAGVIGLAIGFGSQKLVQDIITGLFLLLENAMQVGDVVSLGGMTGTVENLSIRTIRLRAMDGAVHIVPFSAVTTVTNMTRDFGYAVVDVSVGLNEESKRVSDVLRDLAAGMRTETPWRAMILADLEVMGVEKFIDTAWVLRVRIKTLPASRWSVGRELNRRIKVQFDALAIESPMTSYRALSMAPALPTPETVVSGG